MLPHAVGGGKVFATIDSCFGRCRRVCAGRRNRQPAEHMNTPPHIQLAAGEAARRQTTGNKGNKEDWRFGNTRVSVEGHGDTDPCRLRDYHRRGEYGYNRNYSGRISIVARTVLPATRTHNRHRARFGLRAAHWDRPRVCAAAARPGHRCSDRKYLREPGWLATNTPATAAAAAPRERPATTHTRPCSARPASRRDRSICGRAVRAASRRTCTRLAPGRGSAPRAPFPGAAIRHGPGQAIP